MIDLSYSELLKFPDFNSRLVYLTLLDYNYGSPRVESIKFFKSHSWKTLRKQIIFRDLGFDLGVFGVYIDTKILVHHICPVTIDDLRWQTKKLLDPNNLITVSVTTHNIIHYGEATLLKEREQGDTILW